MSMPDDLERSADRVCTHMGEALHPLNPSHLCEHIDEAAERKNEALYIPCTSVVKENTSPTRVLLVTHSPSVTGLCKLGSVALNKLMLFRLSFIALLNKLMLNNSGQASKLPVPPHFMLKVTFWILAWPSKCNFNHYCLL